MFLYSLIKGPSVSDPPDVLSVYLTFDTIYSDIAFLFHFMTDYYLFFSSIHHFSWSSALVQSLCCEMFLRVVRVELPCFGRFG